MMRPSLVASVLGILFPACALAQGHQPLQERPLQDRASGLQVVEPDQHDLDLRMTPTVRAVQKTANAVVSIYLQARGYRGQVTEGQGSGVILDDNGFVITNWHVVAAALLPQIYGDGHSIEVKLRDGRAFAAKVLSSSPKHDLALLQLALKDGEKVQPVEIGRSADLMIGETVIAIGNPQGHANTVTQGVLSATGRSIRVQGPDRQPHEYTGLLQTDAAINGGNSGGALLDITGRLIGINNAMAMNAENIGFAIPVDTVREVFEKDLIGSDSFASASDAAWLGIDVGSADGKVVVTEVTPGSPAAKAGLQAGDVLARINGTDVKSPLDYARTVLTAKAMEPLPLQVQRNGREIDLRPVPLDRAQRQVIQLAGMQLQEVTANQDADLLRKVTRAFYRGYGASRVPMLPLALRVAEVLPDSPASALGLQPGDIILSVVLRDGWGRETDHRLDSARIFASALNEFAGQTLKLVVLRGDDDLVGTLDVRPAPK